jgi:hypothetical protein
MMSTMQSCFVRLAGMVDMLHTSSSGSTARLAQNQEEPARSQIVIIVALMNFERPEQFYSIVIAPMVSTFPTMIAGDAHINRHYL